MVRVRTKRQEYVEERRRISPLWYYRWDDAEVNDLKQLREQGLTAREIGEAMNRTPNAIYLKIRQLRRDGVEIC